MNRFVIALLIADAVLTVDFIVLLLVYLLHPKKTKTIPKPTIPTPTHTPTQTPFTPTLTLPREATAKFTLSSIPMKQREVAMRAAISMAVQNTFYPFGAVITDAKSGVVLAKGVNQTFQNPVLHGEMVCMNNYVDQQGNKNWGDCILYTTGEPCPMCMSALVWAGIGGVVYGSSAQTIKKSGIDIFSFSAKDINEGNNFSQTQLLGGVLEPECNALFVNRQRS